MRSSPSTITSSLTRPCPRGPCSSRTATLRPPRRTTDICQRRHHGRLPALNHLHAPSEPAPAPAKTCAPRRGWYGLGSRRFRRDLHLFEPDGDVAAVVRKAPRAERPRGQPPCVDLADWVDESGASVVPFP